MEKNDLPLPLPDRRISNNREYSLPKTSTNNKYDEEEINKFTPTQTPQSINQYFDIKDSKMTLSIAKIKQIEDMRHKILSYKLLSEKTIFMNTFPQNKINKCNVILFGPSGSGKSSFIKSMYRSLYNSPILPPETINRLIIKNKYHNEGTLLFSQFTLVKECQNHSGIILCDTRGHFKMNENEQEQFKILLDGYVKDGAKLEQRLNRDPLALWEFWKKSSELFPKEIFNSVSGGVRCLPHCVVFVFDGNTDEIIQSEDEKFYKDLVNISKHRGYQNVQIILTRIDEFEKFVNDRYKNLPESEKFTKLNMLKDLKIEKVISKLGVSRSNVHFIENYHLDNQTINSTDIDYHILKTMIDILDVSELYIINSLQPKATCFDGCFW